MNDPSENKPDDLEQFFQKRLDDYDFPFQEKDWEAIEGMLDAADAQTTIKRQKNLLYLFYILTILLGSLGLYLFFFPVQPNPYPGNPLQNLAHRVDTITRLHHPMDPKHSEAGLDPASLKASTSQKNKDPKMGNSNSPETASLIPNPLPENRPMDVDPNHSLKEAVPQKSPAQESIANKNTQPEGLFLQKQNPEKDEAKGDSPSLFISLEKNDEENKVPQLVPKEVDASQSFPAYQPKDQIIVPLDRQSAKLMEIEPPRVQIIQMEALDVVHPSQEKKKNIFARDRWSLGLSYSPDMSSTGLNNFTRPGSKLGGFIEYAISPKFSLQSSLLFSKQKYNAAGSEYTVPAGFWANWTEGMVPSEIQAVCNIIDISLNLKYYFIHRGRTRFYISGGVASYILTREAYTYDFGDPNYNNKLASEWLVENENQHWLGVTNLSAGLEYRISNQFALELEPYLKVPLGGIGFGQVNLFSTGAFLNLKYRLGKK